ncbi:MAG: hypothetical protein Aurels2KO_19750 [Aureliella sp.]
MKKLLALTLATATFTNLSPISVAQDTGGEGPGGVQILGISMATEGEFVPDLQGLAESSVTLAAPGVGGGMFGRVNPNDRSDLFSLLSNESVRKELKLTEQQYEGVKAVRKQSQQRLGELIKTSMQKSEDGRSIKLGGTSFQTIIAENKKAADAAIEEILLPEQLKRVQQLAYQIDVERTGLGASLVEGRLGKDIGVYDNQKQSLTDLAAAIDAETKKAIAKIKADARKQLLSSLPPEQRKQAEELLGEYFDYEAVTLEQQLQRSLRNRKADAQADSKSDKDRKVKRSR